MHDSGNPAATPPPTDPIAEYNNLVDQAGRELDARLAAIRDDAAALDITIREAADERVQVLTEHLDRLKALRIQYLGDDA
jgi:hypothetical protein